MNGFLKYLFNFMLAAAMSLIAALACAQEKSASEWQYEITPYLWAVGIDGTTRIRERSFDSEADFSDLIESFDLGASAAFEARKGRWGILFDGMYFRLKESDAGPLGRSRLKVTQQMYSLGGTWRAMDGAIPVDFVGGLRYNYIKPRIETPLGNIGRSRDALDPFIGIRGQIPLNERWAITGYTDIGTFSGEDWAWQLLLGAKYAINDNMSAKFGYRRYKIDYEKTNFEFTNTMHGLYFGIGMKF